MATYAYKILNLPGRGDTAAFEAELNSLGALGWAIVGMDTVHGRVILMQTTP